MIGPSLKNNRILHALMVGVIGCAVMACNASAEEPAKPSPARAMMAAQPRPATELLGRSLGLTAAILAVGGVVLAASRKISPNFIPDRYLKHTFAEHQHPRVTGRVRLTPRQTVHTVSIGDRVLVLGTGPQGAPELLTEWVVEKETPEADQEEISENQPAGALKLAEAAA